MPYSFLAEDPLMRKSSSGLDLSVASWGGERSSSKYGTAFVQGIGTLSTEYHEIEAVISALGRSEEEVMEACEELCVMVKGFTISNNGEQQRTYLRIVGRKLQEITSQSPSHRKGCLSACEALLRPGEGVEQHAEPSVLQEHILSIHRITECILKTAQQHEEVVLCLPVVRLVLTKLSEAGIGTDIATAISYQCSEWLMSKRAIRRHAGAVLAKELCCTVPHLAAPHVPVLCQSLQAVIQSTGELKNSKSEDLDESQQIIIAAISEAAVSLCKPTTSDTHSSACSQILQSCVDSLLAVSPHAQQILLVFPMLTSVIEANVDLIWPPDNSISSFESIQGAVKRILHSYILKSGSQGDRATAEAAAFASKILKKLSMEKAVEVTKAILSQMKGLANAKKGSSLLPRLLCVASAAADIANLESESTLLNELLASHSSTLVQALKKTLPTCKQKQAAFLLRDLSQLGGNVSKEIMSELATTETIKNICDIALDNETVPILRFLWNAAPEIKMSGLEIVKGKAQEILSISNNCYSDVITTSNGVILLSKHGEYPELRDVIRCLLQHPDYVVRRHSVLLLCDLFTTHIPICDIFLREWNRLFVDIIAVGVSDPILSVRRSVWGSIKLAIPSINRILSSPSCSEGICMALSDNNDFVRIEVLSILVEVAKRTPIIHPRIRTAVQRYWNHLRHSNDALQQATSAELLGIAYESLLLSSPALVPAELTSDLIMEFTLNKMSDCVPGVKGPLIELMVRLMRLNDHIVPTVYNEVKKIAVSVLCEDTAHATAQVPAAEALMIVIRKHNMEPIEVLKEQPVLYSRLLDTCVKEKSTSVRVAVMKLLGTIGAIGNTQTLEIIPNTERALRDSTNVWGRLLTNPDYCSFRVLKSLLNILSEARLRPYHSDVLNVIQIPIKLLGRDRAISLSKDIIPCYIQVAQCALSDERVPALRSVLQAMCSILQQISSNVRIVIENLSEITALALRCTSYQSVASLALQLLEALAAMLGPSYQSSVEVTVFKLLELISIDFEVSSAVKVLLVMGPHLLRPYNMMIAENLCRVVAATNNNNNNNNNNNGNEQRQTPGAAAHQTNLRVQIRVRCLEALSLLTIRNNVAGLVDVAAVILHSLRSLLRKPNNPILTHQLWNTVITTLGDLNSSLSKCMYSGNKSLLKSLFQSTVRAAEESALSLGMNIDIVKKAFDVYKEQDPLADNLEDIIAGGNRKAANSIAGRTQDSEEPTQLDHQAVLRALQGFGVPALWLDNLAQTLLGESPRVSLRAASSVARLYTPLAYDLLGPAFVAFCSEPERVRTFVSLQAKRGLDVDLTRFNSLISDAQSTRQQLLDAMRQVLRYKKLPGEVTQRLLSLQEFYERSREAQEAAKPNSSPRRLDKVKEHFFLLRPIELCRLANQCGLHAKALHWAEAALVGDAEGAEMIEASRSLVKASKVLQIQGAEQGILDKISEQAAKLPELQEEMGMYSSALSQYEEAGNLAGILRCRDNSGDWRTLLESTLPFYREETDASVDLIHITQYVARSAWILGEWDVLQDAANNLLKSGKENEGTPYAGLAHFYKAVAAVNNNNFDEAKIAISQCRLCLDCELAASLGEGYLRAYSTLVSLQQVAELDEIISFKENGSHPDTLIKIKKLWENRLVSMESNSSILRGTLRQRSIIINPISEPEPWLQFCRSCYSAREYRQASDVLRMLCTVREGDIDGQFFNEVLERIGSTSSEDANKIKSKPVPPSVLLSILRFQWNRNPTKDVVENAIRLATLIFRNEKLFNDEDTSIEVLVSISRWSQELKEIDSNVITSMTACVCPPDTKSSQFKITEVISLQHTKFWREWGLLHHSAALRTNNADFVKQAIFAFLNSLNYDSPAIAFPILLRLMDLVFAFSNSTHPEIEAICQQRLPSEISPSLWVTAVTQLVTRLGSGTTGASAIVEDVLTVAGSEYPHAVVYGLLPHVLDNRLDAISVLNRITANHNKLVGDALLIAKQLVKGALLLSMRWKIALEEAYRKYDTPLATLKVHFDELRELSAAVTASGGSVTGDVTLDDVAFMSCANQLFSAEYHWNNGEIKEGWRDAITVMNEYLRPVNKEMLRRGVTLSRISPKLLDKAPFSIAVPGCADLTTPPLIQKFDNMCVVFGTQTVPKKISLIDTAGKKHHFLLKGHEDLRLDQRVMQVLGLSKNILRREGEIAADDIIQFTAVPLGRNVGLLGWVEGGEDLGTAIKGQRHECMTGYEDKIIQKVLKSLKKDSRWDDSPIASKTQALEAVARETDGDDLHRTLWLTAANSETWLNRRNGFVRSLSAMSMVGYVLGLGDRHLGNILLHRETGRIIHIDFGDCFDVTRNRTMHAEKVPFRLTRQLRHATGFGGVGGVFQHTAASTMQSLRKGKELLMAVLEAFVRDPIIGMNPTAARTAVTRMYQKLTGTEAPPNPTDVPSQIHRLVAEATSLDNLSQAFSGWEPWM